MADDNPWKVVSESPAPAAAPSPAGPAAAAPAPSATAQAPQTPQASAQPSAQPSNQWQVVNEVPAEQSVEGDSIDKALVGHPIMQKIDRGLQKGVASGFGVTANDPDNPTQPNTWGGFASQMWSNLKKAAIENYEKGGGGKVPSYEGAPTGPLANLYKSVVSDGRAGAALMTPIHMAASGIEGMASTVEDGWNDIKQGMKGTPGLKSELTVASGAGDPEMDHELIAQGFGKILASAAQIAMSMEKSAVNGTMAKMGAAVEKGAARPGNSILRATNPKSYLYGKVPGRVFIDEPIKMTTSIENLAKQIDDAENNLHQTIRDKLSDPKVSANRVDVVPEIDKIINQAKANLVNEKGLANRAGVIKAIDTVRNDILNKYDSSGNVVGSWTKTRLSPLEVNEMKRSVGKNTKWDTIPGSVDPEIQQYVNDVRKSIYGRLNDIVDDTVANTPGQDGIGMKALNSRYANAIEASRLLAKRLAKEESTELGMRRLLAHGEWAASIGVLLTGNPVGQALGAVGIANRIARSTPGRLARAKGAAAAGRTMQAAGKSGLASTAASVATAAGETGAQDWIHIQTSDGNQFTVHPEDLEKAKQRDPGLKVLTPSPDEESQE